MTREVTSGPRQRRAELRIFPSADAAFARHIRMIAASEELTDSAVFQARLRRFHLRAIVRERVLAGEGDIWYVYRDGTWTASGESWWEGPHVGHLEVSPDGGWFIAADGVARGILGLEPGDLGVTHFSDLLAPGTLRDGEGLYRIIAAGEPFEGTVVIRPLGAEPVAIDLRAVNEGGRLLGWIRLATDIPRIEEVAVPRPASLDCRPAEDQAFAGYARALLDRMPEPTPEGLAMRLRRIYPYAVVRSDGEAWLVERESTTDVSGQPEDEWWRRAGLPRVAFSAQGLITGANAEARELLGSGLVGQHWHDLVTAGTTDAVDSVIEAIRQAGGAVSRFRMPGAEGSMVVFDCYTTVDSEGLVSILRPLSDTSHEER